MVCWVWKGLARAMWYPACGKDRCMPHGMLGVEKFSVQLIVREGRRKGQLHSTVSCTSCAYVRVIGLLQINADSLEQCAAIHTRSILPLDCNSLRQNSARQSAPSNHLPQVEHAPRARTTSLLHICHVCACAFVGSQVRMELPATQWVCVCSAHRPMEQRDHLL